MLIALFTPIVLERDVPSHAGIPTAKFICSWVWPKQAQMMSN